MCSAFMYQLHMFFLYWTDSDPVFLLEPISQFIYLSQTAVFTCLATGHEVKYQWTVGAGSFSGYLTGINNNTLVIPDVKSSDSNTYICVASIREGSVHSKAAYLTVIGMHYLMLL